MRSTEPMSGLNPDAIDEGVSGVSYPPNLADAKEESLKIIEYILFFTKKSFFICICAIFVVILYPI